MKLCFWINELTDLAGFAGAAPGGSQRGAALRLQRGSVDVHLTAAVLYREPASALHAVCGATAEQRRLDLKNSVVFLGETNSYVNTQDSPAKKPKQQAKKCGEHISNPNKTFAKPVFPY